MKTGKYILTRRLVYAILYKFDSLLKRKNNVSILCYHSISDDGWQFSVKFDEFKKQIRYLKENFKIISLNEIEKFIKEKEEIRIPSVAITFDDGYKDIYSIKKYLSTKEIRPFIFVLSNPENVNRKELDNNKQLLSEKEILDLIKEGWEVGCHSATHMNFSMIEKGQAEREIIDSKKILENKFRVKIKYFAYPKGIYSGEILNLVRKEYSMGFSVDDDFINHSSDFTIVPRIGVNGSHTIDEFKALFSPSSILLRKYIGKLFKLFNFQGK